MKRILYVMHISWGWIKQRPQFIAEELSKECHVDVMYRMSNRKGYNLNPTVNNGNLCVKGFRNWPTERIKFLPISMTYQYNKLIWQKLHIELNSYDYIWVTNPVLWWTIRGNFKVGRKTQLIYDCMDDYSAFPYMDEYPRYKAFNEEKEIELIKEADYVFCSADALRKKLISRYGIIRKYHIVNNAITSNIMTYKENVDGIELPENSLIYIGTVSEWFDFANTLKALDENPKLHVVLYGPKRLPEIPSHERLEFRGSTSHENILTIMTKASGLFMPFVVNELIESVNPVKLYEYIYSGKPILASRYGESEPFSQYVSLYSNFEEFDAFIKEKVLAKTNCDIAEMKKFAMDNTWESRVQQIKSIVGING